MVLSQKFIFFICFSCFCHCLCGFFLSPFLYNMWFVSSSCTVCDLFRLNTMVWFSSSCYKMVLYFVWMIKSDKDIKSNHDYVVELQSYIL